MTVAAVPEVESALRSSLRTIGLRGTLRGMADTALPPSANILLVDDQPANPG
jgi:hypothetical protein